MSSSMRQRKFADTTSFPPRSTAIDIPPARPKALTNQFVTSRPQASHNFFSDVLNVALSATPTPPSNLLAGDNAPMPTSYKTLSHHFTSPLALAVDSGAAPEHKDDIVAGLGLEVTVAVEAAQSDESVDDSQNSHNSDSVDDSQNAHNSDDEFADEQLETEEMKQEIVAAAAPVADAQAAVQVANERFANYLSQEFAMNPKLLPDGRPNELHSAAASVAPEQPKIPAPASVLDNPNHYRQPLLVDDEDAPSPKKDKGCCAWPSFPKNFFKFKCTMWKSSCLGSKQAPLDQDMGFDEISMTSYTPL